MKAALAIFERTFAFIDNRCKRLTQPHETVKELACHHFAQFGFHVSVCQGYKHQEDFFS